ncbi:unnamed protein product [Prunus armeniaca]|uniref:Uncharacterized protein n=1 Tax=Prunus armeniaca TaxID=36596 RepID=A0A6J5WDB8_PRUAR|nr:unnamed protein product [Prunus armeniaca]
MQSASFTSSGAQEILKLLPHAFVDPSRLSELFGMAKDVAQPTLPSKRVFQVYGCVVTSKDMVEHIDSTTPFDKIIEYQAASRFNKGRMWACWNL